MIKVIVHLRRDEESYNRLRKSIPEVSRYHEVGTARTVAIFEESSIISLINKANEFAKGKDWRMDIYHIWQCMYKDPPNKVIYRGEKYVAVKRGSERD